MSDLPQAASPLPLGIAGPTPPAPGPGPRIAFLMGLVDRANPMLVRVVRQELRNRAFIAIFLILLSGAALAAMVAAAVITDNAGSEVSRTLFGTLAFGWIFALWVAQPMGCFRAIAAERGDDTWDLVELTGLRPIQVVGGLLLASLVQGLLYTSALAPFMVMAYLLRGIDLLVVLFGLIAVPMGSVLASSLAVFAACLGPNKATRSALGGLLGLGLVGAWLGSIAVCFNLSEVSRELGRLGSLTDEAWLVVLVVANEWLAALALLLVLSSTMLAFRAADRSSRPRLLWWGIWANGWLWTCLPALFFSRYFGWEEWCLAQVVFALVGVCAAGILGLFAVSEDIELSPRQARAITGAKSRLRRAAMLLLGPGAARGRLCWLAMAAASMAIGGIGMLLLGDDPGDRRTRQDLMVAAWLACCWLAIVFTVADRLYRGWLADWFPTPGLRRGFILLLGALWCVLVPLALVIVWKLVDVDVDGLKMFSPAQSLYIVFDHGYGASADGIWSSLASFMILSLGGAAALVVQLVQGLRLRIVTQRVQARDEDRNPRA